MSKEWSYPTIGVEVRPSWRERRRKRRQCFHHEYNGPEKIARSFIKSRLIDTGKRKMFWCDEGLGGCGKTWFA